MNTECAKEVPANFEGELGDAFGKLVSQASQAETLAVDIMERLYGPNLPKTVSEAEKLAVKPEGIRAVALAKLGYATEIAIRTRACLEEILRRL